jgi:hypothetical protein
VFKQRGEMMDNRFDMSNIFDMTTEERRVLTKLLNRLMDTDKPDIEGPSGTLIVWTDWDFGFVLSGVRYTGSHMVIPNVPVSELAGVTMLGGFGAPAHGNTKDDEFEDGLAEIMENPTVMITTPVGNRGVNWHPNVSEVCDD